MFETLILVCAVGLAPHECQIGNAVDVIQGPGTSSMASCGVLGQAYLADTALAPGADYYMKVRCTPAAIERRPVEAQAPSPARAVAER